MNDKTYRKNVGLIVLNPENQLLVCKRKNTKKWQFPQGGVDSNEKPIQAAYRELFEEVGISKKDVKLLKESEHWYKYDLPVDYRRKTINLKKFKGQSQKWFIFKSKYKLEIDFMNDLHEEFDGYQWVSYWYPLSQIIDFKKPVYEKVLKEFLPIYLKVVND